MTENFAAKHAAARAGNAPHEPQNDVNGVRASQGDRREDPEINARLSTLPARARQDAAPSQLLAKRFGGRGLSNGTITALLEQDVDFPEQVLFMSEAELRSIRHVGKVALAELAAYRRRFMVE